MSTRSEEKGKGKFRVMMDLKERDKVQIGG